MGRSPRGSSSPHPARCPRSQGGYAAAVVVDAGGLVGPGLDGEEDAVRLLLGTAAHVRPRTRGGAVLVVGELPEAVVRCVSTWSPERWALDALGEREELGLPPSTRLVEVRGDPETLVAAREAVLARRFGGARAAESAPAREVEIGEGARAFLVTRGAAQRVVDALRRLQIARSRDGLHDLRIRVDGPLVPGG